MEFCEVRSAHGGRARQVRRAAAVRKLDSSLTRGLAVSQQRLRESRADWWTARIMFAAELLDTDPMKLMDEVKGRGWIVSMIGHEWPPGLRLEDEPQIKYDRRFGPRQVVCRPR